MAYGSIYSTNRITGLSSGLDTDQLVKAALLSSQSKLDRLYQNKTSMEWKRDAYTDVRTKVSDFSSKYFSSLSSDNIFSKNVYKQFKVSYSDKYNSFFSIKGTAKAYAGNHTITSAKMATAASLQSAKPVTSGKDTISITGGADVNKVSTGKSSTTLYYKTADNKYEKITSSTDLSKVKLSEVYSDISGQNAVFSKTDDKYTFNFRGTSAKDVPQGTVTLHGTDATLKELRDQMNSMPGQGISMSFDNDGGLSFTSNTVGSNSKIELGAGFGKIALDSQEMTGVKANGKPLSQMSLNDLVKMDGKRGIFGDKGILSFSINGVTFTTDQEAQGDVVKLDKDESLSSIAQKISDSKAGVKMTLSDDAGFQLISEGDGGEIAIKNISGQFFGASGLDSDSSSVTGLREQTKSYAETLDRSKDTGASAAAKMGLTGAFSGGVMTLEVKNTKGEYVKIEFSEKDTIDQMLSKINSNSELGIKVSYSQITDRFEFTTSETGANSQINIKNGASGDALSFFGVAAGADGVASAKGENGEIEIDGVKLVQEKNTFTLDGLEITLKDNFDAGTSEYEGVKLGAAKIGVEQDIDATVSKVKGFVDAYNSLVDELYKMTTEEKDYDYEPLTEEQRENMEKEDIEKWETEAKKGILRNDSTIRTYLSRMRQAIFEKLDGVKFADITGSDEDKQGMSAADIGFGTSKYATGEYGGKIVFDEEKFREALERDPDVVANIMANVSEATDKTKNYSESGFATKLFDITSDFVNTMRGTNIANTNKKINDLNDSMDDLIKKMYDQQETLYKQYAALETLMTQYQNQSTWLSNQLAGLTTS